jgi:Flp pilus assembly pilin Flp
VNLLGQLIADESGQDVIEYGLLLAGIGIAGIALFNVMATAMATTYEAWDTGAQDIWELCDPGETPPC